MPEDTQIAVERSAIQRGSRFIQILASLSIDELLDTVERLAGECDQEDIAGHASEWGISREALQALDSANPPISYVRYFCTPETLRQYPRLVTYYRNIAMLSSEAMTGIGLGTTAYEAGEAVPSAEAALALTRYFNGIVRRLVTTNRITSRRPLEMLSANIGDGLAER